MKFNNKYLQKTSTFINSIIAVVLCGFLILLSGNLIDDVGKWKEIPELEEFQNRKVIAQHEEKIQTLNKQINAWIEKKESVQQTINSAEKKYQNAKESFDNWLKTRGTIGSPNEDQEVLKRANELDAYFKTQQEWEKELLTMNDSIDELTDKRDFIKGLIHKEDVKAREKRTLAFRQYHMKVFLIRLSIILPVLLLGAFFIIRFRRHKYWPLFLGYVLFSFYAFFFGLVPYLPEYGGYIRYSVGIVLIVLFGIYAINKIRSFIEKKKKELKISTEERAKQVLAETAEKALEKHMCPSCGKDYTVKGWDKTLKKNNKTQTYAMITDFCRFCGLELFKKCKSCGTVNYAHLPYCGCCGNSISENKEHEECSNGSS